MIISDYSSNPLLIVSQDLGNNQISQNYLFNAMHSLFQPSVHCK
jgi:hypothetical protein